MKTAKKYKEYCDAGLSPGFKKYEMTVFKKNSKSHVAKYCQTLYPSTDPKIIVTKISFDEFLSNDSSHCANCFNGYNLYGFSFKKMFELFEKALSLHNDLQKATKFDDFFEAYETSNSLLSEYKARYYQVKTPHLLWVSKLKRQAEKGMQSLNVNIDESKNAFIEKVVKASMLNMEEFQHFPESIRKEYAQWVGKAFNENKESERVVFSRIHLTSAALKLEDVKQFQILFKYKTPTKLSRLTGDFFLYPVSLSAWVERTALKEECKILDSVHFEENPSDALMETMLVLYEPNNKDSFAFKLEDAKFNATELNR